MKFTIDGSVLLSTLSHIQNIVERRNTIPIISNVRMVADAEGLEVAATDMDMMVVERVNCDTTEPGAITVPVHTLYDIARKLPNGAQAAFSANPGDARVKLIAAHSDFNLAYLAADDFPVLKEEDLPIRFTLSAEALKRLLEKTRFAVSNEETRYYLNGIFLHAAEHSSGKQFRAVATDGHRLARADADLPSGAGDMPGIILPRKAVNELFRLLEGVDTMVDVALSAYKARFVIGELILTTKLIDGTFPDYDRVIPADNTIRIDVDCDSFREAVDRVSTISQEKSRAVKLVFDADKLTMSTVSPEQGSAFEEMEIEYDGDAIEIGFNARYLLDIANQIDGDYARFVINNATSPTLIEDSGDEKALFVLMPMRV